MEAGDDLSVDRFSGGELPVVRTSSIQMGLDYFTPRLRAESMQPFILVGPEGCGKGCVTPAYHLFWMASPLVN